MNTPASNSAKTSVAAKAYKIFSVLGWLSGLTAFVFSGIAVLSEYPVLGILCFSMAALGAIVGIVQRGRIFSGKRKKIGPRTILWYIVLTGVFVALLISGSYNTAVIMFGVAIVLNIAANIALALGKE